MGVSIIDYGAGNLKSVQNALDSLGAVSGIVTRPEDVFRADRLILPGVGSFGAAIKALNSSGLDKAITEFIKTGRPFLGICLGLQLLFESSEESAGCAGLSLIKGRVEALPRNGQKVPQVGWNSLDILDGSKVFENIPNGSYFYFVHSFYAKCVDMKNVIAVTEYGVDCHVAVRQDNITAVQFHPEKSGTMGLKLLKNFIL